MKDMMNETKSDNVQPGENRAFMQMRKPALERLAGREAKDIAKKAGITYDEENQVFHLNSLNQSIEITYPDYEMTPQLEQWQHLIILHYLDWADEVLPGNELITFGLLKDGMVRGGGFDHQCEQAIEQTLGKQSPEVIEEACKSLGGKILSSNADLCAEFSFLPFYPVTLKIWFADDEFPASGRMFLDKTADHYLSVEDAVTVGALILDKLSDLVKCDNQV